MNEWVLDQSWLDKAKTPCKCGFTHFIKPQKKICDMCEYEYIRQISCLYSHQQQLEAISFFFFFFLNQWISITVDLWMTTAHLNLNTEIQKSSITLEDKRAWGPLVWEEVWITALDEDYWTVHFCHGSFHSVKDKKIQPQCPVDNIKHICASHRIVWDSNCWQRQFRRILPRESIFLNCCEPWK